MDDLAPCYEAVKTLDPLLAGIKAMNAAPPRQELAGGPEGS